MRFGSGRNSQRVLFYSDTVDYGGHEALTVEVARYLATQQLPVNVVFAFYEGNKKLSKRLTEIKNMSRNFELWPLKIRSRSLQTLRTLLSPWLVNSIGIAMKRIRPDVVVVSQGRIESGSLGLLAAKRAGLRTVTYIPMAHHISICGKPLAAAFRERINRYFYTLPDKIITISETTRRMLLARGTISNVVVVQNGVEMRASRNQDREMFRNTHGVLRDDCVVATLGRIDFRQKGQDFAVQAISRYRSQLMGCKFLFIGCGPDEGRLKALIERVQLQDIVRILPWTDKLTEIYSGIDMLLIPSKFEGVPLVMLEAMSCKLPIVASDVDGMAELLPRNWLFPYGDCEAMAMTLSRVKTDDNGHLLEINQKRIANEFTNAKFCVNFSRAVLACET